MRILYLFILSITVSSWAQENNHWQLGQTDIKFQNSSTTTNNISNTGNNGSAIVSDINGNMLFYTDGNKFWNKNHALMTNSSNSSYGSISSNLQPVVIVPHPNNNKIYYVFESFNDVFGDLIGSPLVILRYKIVSFEDVNFPLGKVIEPSNSYLINTNSVGHLGSITLTKNNDGTAYFLIFHEQPQSDTGGGRLHTFKIDGTGFIQTPVAITDIPNNIGFTSFQQVDGFYRKTTYGICRINSNNKFGELVITETKSFTPSFNIRYSSRFYTMDFNNVTGAFTNFTFIEDTDTSQANGCNMDFEFSNSSSNIYFGRGNSVYVKDLSNLSQASRKISSSTNNLVFPAGNKLQRDKFNNILIGTFGSNKLSRILNDNSYTNSSIETDYISLYTNFDNNYQKPSRFPQLIPALNLLQVCNTSPLVLNTEINTGSVTYENYSSITLQTNYDVNLSTQNITLKAKDFILLKPNTQIKSGSVFSAKIKACLDPLVVNRKSSNEEESINNIFIDSSNMKMYPNPSNSIVTFNSTEERINKITIVSLDGKVVVNQLVNNLNEYQLNISILENGIYIVSIETKEGKTHTQKLIKN